jgi:anti-repressor protein
VNAVNARDLHTFLEVKTRFNDWINLRIREFDFQEHRDFELYSNFSNVSNQQLTPTKEYAITLDMAKELAMVERNDRGKQARQYFIECERRALAAPVAFDPRRLSRLDLITLAMDAERERLTLAAENAVLKPKADFHDQVHSTQDCLSMSEFAKANGTGLNRMFKWLRKAGFIMKSSTLPFQRYIDQGLFKVVEETFQDKHNRDRIFMKTLVTGKGQITLAKHFRAQGEEQKIKGLGA